MLYGGSEQAADRYSDRWSMTDDQRGDGSRLVKNDVSSYFVVRHRWIHFFERCVLFVFFSCLPRRNNSSITTGLALKVGFCFCNTLTIHHTTTCFLSNNIRAPHLDCLCQVVPIHIIRDQAIVSLFLSTTVSASFRVLCIILLTWVRGSSSSMEWLR